MLKSPPTAINKTLTPVMQKQPAPSYPIRPWKIKVNMPLRCHKTPVYMHSSSLFLYRGLKTSGTKAELLPSTF